MLIISVVVLWCRPI